MDTSTHKSLVICSVWTVDDRDKLEQTKQGSKFPLKDSGVKIAQGKLSNLFRNDDTDLSTEEMPLKEENAKLLVLTTDSVALLDPQTLDVNKESLEAGEVDTLTYSLPFSRIKEIQSDGKKLTIQYFISVFEVEEAKAPGSNKTIFGFLSPQKLLPAIHSKSIGENSRSFSDAFDDSLDVRSVSASFVLRSEKEATELMEKIKFHRWRLQNAISWLNDGLPFVKEPYLLTVTKLDSAAEGTSRHVVLSEFPKPSKRIPVSVPRRAMETTTIVFTLSSPFGPCKAVMNAVEFERNCGKQDQKKDIVKALPIFETGTYLPDYSISIEYSIERGVETSSALNEFPPRHLTLSLFTVFLGILWQSHFGVQGVKFLLSLVVILSILYLIQLHSKTKKEGMLNFCLVYHGSTIVEEARISSVRGNTRQQETSEEIHTFESMKLQYTGISNLAKTSVRRSVKISRLGMQQYEMMLEESTSVTSVVVTEKEANQLQELHQISKVVDIDLYRRYIAACKGDRHFAMQRLRTTAEWRAEHSVDSILEAPIPYFHLLKQNYVHAVIGRSKCGLPVVVEGMGKFRETMVALRKEGIVPGKSEEIIHQFVFVIEWITRVLDRTEFPKGQFIRIYDMKGIRLSDVADSEAVHLGKQMMDVLENHYPERMAKALIINVPGFFSALWRMAKPLLDPHTAKKIQVISKKSKILPALREVMDESVIPKAYGGQGVNDFYDSAEESLIRSLARKNNGG